MSFCPKCGSKLSEGAKFCASCGAAVNADHEIPKADNADKTQTAATESIAAKQPNPKKKFILIATGILAMALIFVVLILVNHAKNKPLTAAELLDLGEKYLLEMDYEQAIVAFERLIEIEPKNERAYTGLAESYVALDDTDKAIVILQQGLEELPGSIKLADLLYTLLPPINEEINTENASDNEPNADEQINESENNSNENYQVFYDVIVNNKIIKYNIYGTELNFEINSGGLLDFNSDNKEDLVLIYKIVDDDSFGESVCFVYTYENGEVIKLFDEILITGGNGWIGYIVANDGKGSMCMNEWPMPEGDGPHAFGGYSNSYRVFQNGAFKEELKYYVNNYVLRDKIDHQVWEIYRNETKVNSGTAAPDVSIPEIVEIENEILATYGAEWTPVSIDELIGLLGN